MYRTILFLLLVNLATAIPLYSQSNPKDLGLQTITEESLQAQLEFLASDWTTGRDAGTAGEFMAADYIASLFKIIGLKPGGDREYRLTGRPGSRAEAGAFGNRSWFQNFNLLETSPGDDQSCRLIKRSADGHRSMDLNYLVDYSINPGAISTGTEAPLVFVGYGLGGGNAGFDDYKKLDVKGKIIVRLQGFPGWRNPASKNYQRFSGPADRRVATTDRIKDSIAIARGAIGVIDIRLGATDNFQSPANIPFRYNQAHYEGDEPFRPAGRIRLELPRKELPANLTRITLSQRVQNTILSECAIDPAEYERIAANSKPRIKGDLGGYSLQYTSTVNSRWIRVRNVIGILEGEDTENCIVLGAHYDHVGQVRGFIYNGSDDNASGTVGIISVARAMAATGQKPKTTIIFCAWTSEEKGLLGSAYYAENPLIKNIRCYMNYDMISRTALDDPSGMKCDFNYSSGSPLFRELTEKHITGYGLRLDMAYQSSPVPVGGSDFSSFSVKGIPIFLIHGKFTPDYHQYTDHADKAVMPYFADIVRLGYLNIFELANNQW
jgi:Zn-dependent M28 family amino/carboxypeptidase